MIYLYDDAICEDLRTSLNTESSDAIRIVGPEYVMEIAAQLQEDKISFPLITVYRKQDTQIDTELSNFTRMHKGVAAVIDHDSNNLYYERAIPIKLSYELSALTTNTADMDEILRELIFKYMDMYFLSIKLPYEADRHIRFGVQMDMDTGIERSSSTGEYLETGLLYQSTITLNCIGAVLVNYVPQHLKRIDHDTIPIAKGQSVI